MTTRATGITVLLCLLGVMLSAGCSGGTTPAANTESPSCIQALVRSRLLGRRPAPPKELSAPLQASIVASFDVFRRSALPIDEPPIEAGSLGRELVKDYELSSYYPAYVRQLERRPNGARYFVVPAFGRYETTPSSCGPAALHRRLVEQQRRRLTEPVYCIIETGGSKNASPPGCEPFAAVDESFPVFRSVGTFSPEPTVGLVPDGVASLRIAYRETDPILVRVSNNAFVFTPPPASARLTVELRHLQSELEGTHVSSAQRTNITLRWNKALAEAQPIRIEWLNSAGGLVRTISAPTSIRISATSVGNLRAPIEG
jgi:hypothetical protein